MVLIGLYLIPKIVGKLLNLDKNTNIKGDNHVATIAILLIAPTTLGLHKLFGFCWRSHLIPGIILITLFSIWSWADEKKQNKKTLYKTRFSVLLKMLFGKFYIFCA